MPKLLSDTLVIARLQTLRTVRPPYVFVMSMLLLPLPMLYFAHFLVPDAEDAGPRLLAGSIVFSVGLNTVGRLAVQLTDDRFTYRLNLIRGCPVHPVSYAAGMVLAGVGRAMLNACLILIFAPLFGIDVHLNLMFLPVVALTAVSMSGLALIIGTWAPSWETGSTVSGVCGTFVVLLSPIYFPLSRLPDWLQPIARLSPYTHAAQALTAILSGSGRFAGDVAILAAITVVGMAIGTVGMRWRES